MRAKVEEQRRARALRAQGWSLRRIAAEFGVALSSVSVWVRDVVPVISTVLEPAHWVRLPIAGGEFKRCGKCRVFLPLEAFNRHPEVGRQHWCRGCFKTYFRERGSRHRRQVDGAKRARQATARAYVVDQLRASRCVDCGEADIVVLDFDHVAPGKTATISSLVGSGCSEERLATEIAKCEVVCANCHRKRTAARRDCWRQRHVDGTFERHAPSDPRIDRNLRFVRAVLASAQCADRGERDIRALEFDHVGTKRSAVTKMVWDGHSLRAIRAEIDECEIRCTNCHRKRTAELGGHLRMSHFS